MISYSPPTSEELELIVRGLKRLEGARLQEIETSENYFALGFYSGGNLQWLLMDLRPKSLGLFCLDQRPSHKLHKMPLTLFLNAHFRDKRLVEIIRNEQLGRVVELRFSSANGPTIELVLIPTHVNVTAVTVEKKISLNKPREILAQNKPSGAIARPPSQIFEQWQQRQILAQKMNSSESMVSKKEKALAKVKEDLLKKTPKIYRDLGNYLVSHQTLEVPPEFKTLIDSTATLAENIERAFQKAKDQEQKVGRTALRIKELEQELEILRKNPNSFTPGARTSAAPKLKKVEYQARTLKLAENIEFLVGKSAKDNLAILRQSRGWDIWIHIKDRPGSHGVLFRNKNQNITDEVLKKAAQFLVPEKLRGETLEFLVTECRFVRPIKGDKLGRVTHHNARTLRVAAAREN